MSVAMEEIFTSLDELEALVNKTNDPMEKEGLKAFIKCISPQLMNEASFSLLGKIAQTVGSPLETIKVSTSKELIAAIGSEYVVTVE
ncbi:histidine kinase [Bacillus sp. WMMC1349]|uniref:histidine kinase n=1 Tax=Bacillus sp. WMMC1349 TaxID=2736254 RepID=UPI001552DE88|nr:histidine kinase [Bacillus sp. WMMC1349]NPC91254.1 histidine kinase [Bacillus sp. WMMC1349]